MPSERPSPTSPDPKQEPNKAEVTVVRSLFGPPGRCMSGGGTVDDLDPASLDECYTATTPGISVY